MDAYYGYGLDSQRERNTLILDILMGIITPEEAAELLKGHPCEDEVWAHIPGLKGYPEPPDDDTSSSI